MGKDHHLGGSVANRQGSLANSLVMPQVSVHSSLAVHGSKDSPAIVVNKQGGLAQSKLPQTGNDKSKVLSEIGFASATLLILWAAGKLKRRRD